MFCHKCGTELADDAGFCHNCGVKVVRDGVISEPLNVSAANEMSTSTAEPSVQKSAAAVQTIDLDNISINIGNDFKAFVDNHIRTTTKYQSAEELLNSRVPGLFGYVLVLLPCWAF